MRIHAGLVLPSYAGLIAAGIAGVLVGINLGMKRAERVDERHLRIVIYALIGVSGLVTILKNLI